MRILVLADEESPYFWDYYRAGRLDGIDLILSCGDLKPEYLSFLVTMGRAPLLYVHGNHDGVYEKRPPEGCDCIDGKLVTVKGLRILGLGGCKQYSGGPHQYTERKMRRRILHLYPRLWLRGGVDLVLTHAPVRGYGDREDPAHQGFQCFQLLLDRFRPAYLFHGHVHKRYGSSWERTIPYNDHTTLVNACGYYILEYSPSEKTE